MEYADKPLPLKTIQSIQQTYGDYVKITADITKHAMVIGCELHADGEEILLRKGSAQADIWGGGIHFPQKEIDATAVLNLRPGLGNPSMEILDRQRRERFLSLVKDFFKAVWQT